MYILFIKFLIIFQNVRSLGLSIDDINIPSFQETDYNFQNQSSGSWNEAMTTMTFHRNKMNEFLCRNFLASEIDRTFQKPILISNGRSLSPYLDDPGSSQYKDWLSRSTTLEDIYQHYELETAEDASQENSVGEYDGEVTGYAMVGNTNSNNNNNYNKVADHTGYGVGTSYGVPQYQSGSSVKKSDKGMKLAELFQLALTAIAFLAFGMFIVEIIMCIMGMDNQQMQIITMQEPYVSHSHQKHDDLHGVEYQEISTSRRGRQLFNLKLNQLTAKALLSFEALMQVQEDQGACLKWAICKGNQFSKTLTGVNRIWIPLWNFGMSWMGVRLLEKSLLNSSWRFLESAIMGIGGSNCTKIYKNCTIK